MQIIDFLLFILIILLSIQESLNTLKNEIKVLILFNSYLLQGSQPLNPNCIYKF